MTEFVLSRGMQCSLVDSLRELKFGELHGWKCKERIASPQANHSPSPRINLGSNSALDGDTLVFYY